MGATAFRGLEQASIAMKCKRRNQSTSDAEVQAALAGVSLEQRRRRWLAALETSVQGDSGGYNTNSVGNLEAAAGPGLICQATVSTLSGWSCQVPVTVATTGAQLRASAAASVGFLQGQCKVLNGADVVRDCDSIAAKFGDGELSFTLVQGVLPSCVSDATLWLDAGAENALESKGGGQALAGPGGGTVVCWRDVSGSEKHAVAYVGCDTPTRGSINAMPAVHFRTGQSLRGSRGVYNTIALVVQPDRKPGMFDALFGTFFGGMLLRFSSGEGGDAVHACNAPQRGDKFQSYARPHETVSVKGGAVWLNGQKGVEQDNWKGYPTAPVVIVATSGSRPVHNEFTYQLSTEADNGFDGNIGEVFCFPAILEPHQVLELSEHLMVKWGIESRK